jgi:hypothetical protein
MPLRINILWLMAPKVSKKLDIIKSNILLTLVSRCLGLNREHNIFLHLPSLMNIPPRKGRRSQVKHVFSMAGEHTKSKCWLKLEDSNEAMRQPKISMPKPSSSGKWHALFAQDLYASLNS